MAESAFPLPVPSDATHAGVRAPVSAGPTRNGTVQETMNGGGYTYVHLVGCDQDVWVAGPLSALNVGDTVVTPPGSMMTTFASRSLKRTFDEIYLVGTVQVVPGPVDCDRKLALTPVTPPTTTSAPLVASRDAGAIKVAQAHTQIAELAGARVQISGQVTKFSSNILGLNWVHLSDGSGDAAKGTDDLTLTTAGVAAVGDQVTVDGILVADKDFGAGYRYAVILQEATLTPKQ